MKIVSGHYGYILITDIYNSYFILFNVLLYHTNMFKYAYI